MVTNVEKQETNPNLIRNEYCDLKKCAYIFPGYQFQIKLSVPGATNA